MVDLPYHMLFAEVHANPEAFAGWWTPNNGLTGQGLLWVVRPFLGGGTLFAARCGISVVAVAGFAAFALAWRCFDGPRSPAVLAAGPVFVGFLLAMGFVNFLFGLAAGVAAVGLTHAARRHGTLAMWLAASGLLLVATVLHVVAGLMACVQAGLVVLVMHGRGSKASIGRIAAAATPAVAYAAVTLWIAFDDYVAVGMVERTPPTRLPLVEQAQNVVATAFGGYTNLGLLAVATIAAILAGTPRERRPLLWATVGAWALGYAIIPFHGLGWAFAQPRPLIAGFAFAAILGGRLPRWRVQLGIAATAGVLYTLSWCAGAHGTGARVARAVEEFGDAAPGVTTVAPIDPMRSPYNAWVDAGRHVGAYAVLNGGTTNGLTAFSSTVHGARPVEPPGGFGTRLPQDLGVMFDCELWADCAVAARDVTDRIALAATTLDSVVVVGFPEDVADRLVARGFSALPGATPLAEATSGTVIRLAPTTLDVVFDGGDALVSAAVEVRVGLEGPIGWFRSVERSPSQPVLEAVHFGDLPAGELALGVWVDGEATTLRRIALTPGENQEHVSLRWPD